MTPGAEPVIPAEAGTDPTQGFPKHGDPFRDPATQVTPEAPPAPVAPSSEGVVIGDKTFQSSEEAIAYAQQLKRAQQIATVAVSPVAQQTIAPPSAPSEPNVSEIIFSDPKAALALHAEQIKQDLRREEALKEQTRQVNQRFYSKFEDLKGHEDIVDMHKNKNWEGIKDLPIDQAMDILALSARKTIANIRNGGSTGTQLSSKPAVVSSASGQPATPMKVAQATAPTNFIAELAAMRSRGKK